MPRKFISDNISNMTKIFFIGKNDTYIEKFNEFSFEVNSTSEFNNETFNLIDEFEPDIVILDDEISDSKIVLKQLISKNSNNDFSIIFLIDEKNIEDFDENDIFLLSKPLNPKILINELKKIEKIKTSYNLLHKENQELKKNLYQIDVLYNASSKFAGTLEKEKLYEVAFEIFERVLSFDLASFLVNDNFEGNKLKFYINSLKKTTDEFNSNLIKNLSRKAKEENLDTLKPNHFELEIIQKTKPSYKNEFFDNEIENYDKLTAPVIIKGKFEGIFEIIRKNPFTKEDITCFQSIIHQLLAPLRSAILYEDIINANKKLKNLEKIKSEFVSIVSHELRTPLTPINNALGIILSEQGGKIGDINKNFVNIAKRNVSRLSGIIEDLLDLSRMQTGKFDFKFKKTDIYPSLELAYNTFKTPAQNKNLEFELILDDGLPEVYIDPHRIDQILSNLITNAIKFTPEGGKITIEAKTAGENSVNQKEFIFPSQKQYKGNYLKISVKDTGIGIEKDNIPKIFDKFSQIENSLARTTGGIGLGLTITKHFIDAHLGAIWVDSTKNEGSSFNFIIPVYSEQKEFEAELNLKIKNETETGFIKIEEQNKENDFYRYLKDTNIIKLTKHSKEHIYNMDDKSISEVFISDLDRCAYDFMISKIEEEINSKDKSCDIVLTKAYYKKDTV